MSQQEHKSVAPRFVRCFVLTVSDTRTEATDTSGHAIVELLTAAGHLVAGRRIVKDEPRRRRARGARRARATATSRSSSRPAAPASPRATAPTRRSIELLDKRLDGFGELFRMLSYEEIGPAAMHEPRRAPASPAAKIIVALPGSEGAVRLAMTKLVDPRARTSRAAGLEASP